jgi:hypothetical protein
MKNSFVQFFLIVVLTAALAYGLGLFFPWWTIAIAAFVVGLAIPASPGNAFLGGLIGGFLLWGGMSYLISEANQDILAHRMSMLVLKQDDPLLLELLTGAIGGFVAALGALSGAMFRSIFSKS